MKLARFNIDSEPVACARTGIVLDGAFVGDLRAGYARYLAEVERDGQARELAMLRIPPDVRQILHLGAPAHAAIEAAAAWLSALQAHNPEARGLQGEPLFTQLARARLHNPVKPGRIVVVKGNRAGSPGAMPYVWNRAAASVMGPVRDLPLPAPLAALSYGTALGVVIGKGCHAVSERDAMGAIAGFTVANEVEEARPAAAEVDIAGDTGFRRCIIGPYLIEAADIPDVDALRMTTRINGIVCQSGDTGDVKWRLARLVSRLSVHGLEAGDVVITALLSDVQPPDGTGVPYLRAGDVLESEIEGLGTMRNKVVAEGARA